MKSTTLSLMIAATLLIATSPLQAQTKGVGWTTSLTGNVKYTSSAASQEQKLLAGQEIFDGMTVITGSNSAARLLFNNDHVLTLSQNSKLTITQYLAGPQKTVSRFDLLWGRIRAAVAGKIRYSSGERFEIKTKNAVAGVRGSVIGVDYDPDADKTKAGCGSGDCYVQVDGKDSKLPAGQLAEISGNTLGPLSPLKPGDPGYFNPQGQYDGDGGENNSPADDGLSNQGKGTENSKGQDTVNGLNNPAPDLDPLILDVIQDGPGNPYENYGFPPIFEAPPMPTPIPEPKPQTPGPGPGFRH